MTLNLMPLINRGTGVTRHFGLPSPPLRSCKEEDGDMFNCSYSLEGLVTKGPSVQLDASRKEGLQ